MIALIVGRASCSALDSFKYRHLCGIQWVSSSLNRDVYRTCWNVLYLIHWVIFTLCIIMPFPSLTDPITVIATTTDYVTISITTYSTITITATTNLKVAAATPCSVSGSGGDEEERVFATTVCVAVLLFVGRHRETLRE